MIELIRAGRTEDALDFAQEYLAPHGEQDPRFLEELGAPHVAHKQVQSCTSR